MIQIPIVDTLINAFKRSPNTHKLGILYCTDSVVRQWIARGGVNNAGVQKLTDSLPSLMDELLATAPADQKVCLVDYCDGDHLVVDLTYSRIMACEQNGDSLTTFR